MGPTCSFRGSGGRGGRDTQKSHGNSLLSRLRFRAIGAEEAAPLFE